MHECPDSGREAAVCANPDCVRGLVWNVSGGRPCHVCKGQPAPAAPPPAAPGFPRRNRTLQWSLGERALQDAVDVVERMGADIRLTDAVILLGKARDRVADFVDGIAPESTVYPPAATYDEPEPLVAALSILDAMDGPWSLIAAQLVRQAIAASPVAPVAAAPSGARNEDAALPAGEPGTPERFAWLVGTADGLADLQRRYQFDSSGEAHTICLLAAALATERATREALRTALADQDRHFMWDDRLRMEREIGTLATTLERRTALLRRSDALLRVVEDERIRVGTRHELCEVIAAIRAELAEGETPPSPSTNSVPGSSSASSSEGA